MGWQLGQAAAGHTDARALLTLPDSALDRHLYLLGASGSGKSRLLELLVRQHLRSGAGFGLIDPHGDLVRNVLAFVREQQAAGDPAFGDLDRLWLAEPFADDGLPGLNALDPAGGPLHPHVGELVAIFRRLWASSWGPRMEQLWRQALLTLALGGYTLVEVPALLTDAEFRSRIVAALSDPVLREFWELQFEPLSDAGRVAMIEPILNKTGALLADPRVRAMLGQTRSPLNLRRLMDEGAWLLFNCSKGRLRDAAHLLGSLLVAQCQSAALSRAEIPEAKRRPFTLFVDEFQNFRGDDFETILCEARKYRLRLVIAHQHLGQLDSALQNAIFGNVGTHVVFAVSPQDAGIVSRGLAGGIAVEELVHLPTAHAILHRRSEPLVRLRVLPVQTPETEPLELERFASGLRRRHGRPLAKIEVEIASRRTGSAPKPAHARRPPRKRAPKAPLEPAPAPALPVESEPVVEADDD